MNTQTSSKEEGTGKEVINRRFRTKLIHMKLKKTHKEGEESGCKFFSA